MVGERDVRYVLHLVARGKWSYLVVPFTLVAWHLNYRASPIAAERCGQPASE